MIILHSLETLRQLVSGAIGEKCVRKFTPRYLRYSPLLAENSACYTDFDEQLCFNYGKIRQSFLGNFDRIKAPAFSWISMNVQVLCVVSINN